MDLALPKKAVIYSQKFRSAWTSDNRFKEWLEPVTGDDTQAACKFCCTTMQAHLSSLIGHIKGRKHHDNMRGLKAMAPTHTVAKDLKPRMDSTNDVVDRKMRIGFIGAGRMAQSLSLGFSNAGVVKVANIICSDPDSRMLESIKTALDIQTTRSNEEVVQNSDVVILAVKPHNVTPVLEDISSCVTKRHLIISIAAGITTSQIENLLPAETRVVRVMPNTPALVQCAASVFCLGLRAQPNDSQLVNKLFSSVGYCTQLAESHLDAVTALSGSGPAYAFMVIEALADGGVKMGLPRDVAQKLAAQTMMGASKMVLETGKHPGELKDMVCSPGGTTIEALHHLEVSAVRGAFIGAVEVATKRSQSLSSHV